MKPDRDDETSTTRSLLPSIDAQPVAGDTKLAGTDASASATDQHIDRNIVDADAPHTAPDAIVATANAATTNAATTNAATTNAAAARSPSPDATQTSASVAAGLALELPVAPILHHAPKRYQIIADHGQGGLGRVSRAHDRDLHRDVAIKELIARNELAEARFLREAMITARLEHPGIVPVHEAGRWPDGTPFYAMKLVAGRPLRDLIAERKTVDERIGLLHHVIAVADAIAYAHGRNIIHRDLKPANVIVGDFGETVVIDWGLAKDLSAADLSLDPEAGSEPAAASAAPAASPSTSLSLRIASVDDLTTTGSVLGTPAYMPPEQERGEHVDQRADVFAIGAMLWELCSLQKVPPTEPRLRHRLLRRAGIDRDLITILDKALARDPALRYADAGALAADLKAFKAGARISARTYSLAASIAHWTRHHRALSISFALFIALLLAGGLFYTHRITQQQHQTQRALERAETSEHELSGAHADLTLKHAELLLGTDPSAAADTLDTYHGTDTMRLERLRADARGLGIATLRATPHRKTVRWAAERSDGSIVSLSTDGTIARTTRDGRSEVLFRGVSPRGRFAVSKTTKMIAYGCDPAALCLWQWDSPASKPIIVLDGVTLSGLAFAPNGKELSVVSYDGKVYAYDISVSSTATLARPIVQAEAAALLYFDNDAVAMATQTGLQFLSTAGIYKITLRDYYVWDSSLDQQLFAIATTAGTGFIVRREPWRLTSPTKLCNGSASALRFLPNSRNLAFSCKDGTIGIWDPDASRAAEKTRVPGHPHLLTISDDGSYLVANAENGTLAIVNLKTGITSRYRGHGVPLAHISIDPTRPHELLSADTSGKVRLWELPSSELMIKTYLHSPNQGLSFFPVGHTAIATTYFNNIVIISPEVNDILLGPHLNNLVYTTVSDDGDTFAAYGHHETIEIWSLRARAQLRQLRTTQGAVSALAFASNGDIIVAGRDGRLTRWQTNGTNQILTSFKQPLTALAIAKATNDIVVATSDGTLVCISNDGRSKQLRSNGGNVTQLLSLDHSTKILVVQADGNVFLLDTVGDSEISLLNPGLPFARVSVSKTGLVLGSATDYVAYSRLSPSGVSLKQPHWERVEMNVGDVAIMDDDTFIGVSKDNKIRAYSARTHRWWSRAVESAELLWIHLAPDERYAVILDIEGRAMWLDVARVRSKLSKSSVTATEFR